MNIKNINGALFAMALVAAGAGFTSCEDELDKYEVAGGKFYLTKEVFEKVKVKVGSKLIVYKDPTIKGQVQINKNENGWPNITTIADWNPSERKLEYIFDETAVEVANSCGFAIQGELTGVTKITILP